VDQARAKEVGGLGCAVIGNQHLGQAAVVVAVGGERISTRNQQNCFDKQACARVFL
jgi:hypothetical protein